MERITKYGSINISDRLFAESILGGIKLCGDVFTPVSADGRLISGLDKKVSAGELAPHLTVKENESGITILFNVIAKFGVSLRETASLVLKHVLDETAPLFPGVEVKASVRIVGIKSRAMASRNVIYSMRRTHIPTESKERE